MLMEKVHQGMEGRGALIGRSSIGLLSGGRGCAKSTLHALSWWRAFFYWFEHHIDRRLVASVAGSCLLGLCKQWRCRIDSLPAIMHLPLCIRDIHSWTISLSIIFTHSINFKLH